MHTNLLKLVQAEVLSSLSHPCIVTMYGVAKQDQNGDRYMHIVMARADMSLKTCIRENGRPSPVIVLTWAHQIAAALSALHRSGFVHG